MRKKQIRISKAMTIRKIKLERVSKPSQLARDSRGCGKMAMRIKMMGRRSQAIEWRTDRRFLARLTMMSNSKMTAAIDISICKLVMLSPYSD